MFYGPPKLHKAFLNNFPKTSTIVAKINSFVEIISKYIDYYLSKLITFVVTHLEDSFSLIEDLMDIQKPLPQICLLPTADAISMCTKIHTDHDITTVEKYMNIYKVKLEQDFPRILLIKLLTIVMKQTTFTFGDWFFLYQGTAMGTTCAVKYATIYCALNEEETIIPKFKDNLFFFMISYTYGIMKVLLTGKFSKKTLLLVSSTGKSLSKTKQLTFLATNNYDITNKTFEKELNLHNYLPSNSAHPPDTPKSLIIGFLTRYWTQNTKRRDVIKQVQLFAQRLHRRGYTKNFILLHIL